MNVSPPTQPKPHSANETATSVTEKNQYFQKQHSQTLFSSGQSNSTRNITGSCNDTSLEENHAITITLFTKVYGFPLLLPQDPQIISLCAKHLKYCLEKEKYNNNPQLDGSVNKILNRLFNHIIPTKYRFPKSKTNYSRSIIYNIIKEKYLTLLETNTYGQVIYKDNKVEYTLIYCLPKDQQKTPADLCKKLQATYFTPQSAQHLIQCLENGKYTNSLKLDDYTNKRLQKLFNQILSIKLNNSDFNHIVNISSSFYNVIKEYLEIAQNDNGVKHLKYTNNNGAVHTLAYYPQVYRQFKAIQDSLNDSYLKSEAIQHLMLCLNNATSNTIYTQNNKLDDHINNELENIFSLIRDIKYKYNCNEHSVNIMKFLNLLETNTYGQVIYNDLSNEYTLIHCLPEEQKHTPAELCDKINKTLFTPESAQHLVQCLDTGKYIISLNLDNTTNQHLQNLFNQILSIKVDNTDLPLHTISKFYLALKAYLTLAKDDKSGESIYYTDEGDNSYTLTYYSRTHKILTTILNTPLTPDAAKHLRACLKNNQYGDHKLETDHTSNEILQNLFNLIKPIKINTTSWIYARSECYNLIKEYLESVAANITTQIKYTENNISYSLINRLPDRQSVAINQLFNDIITTKFTNQTAAYLMQCLDAGKYLYSLELDDTTNQNIKSLFNQILSIKIADNLSPLDINSECYLAIIKYLTFIKDGINGQIIYIDSENNQHYLTHLITAYKTQVHPTVLFDRIKSYELTPDEAQTLYTSLINEAYETIINNPRLKELYNLIQAIKIEDNIILYNTVIIYLGYIINNYFEKISYTDPNNENNSYILAHHLPIRKLFQQIQEAQLTPEEGQLLLSQLITTNPTSPITYSYDKIIKNKTKSDVEVCLNNLYNHITLVKPTSPLTTPEELQKHPYHIILNYLGEISNNQTVEEITYTDAKNNTCTLTYKHLTEGDYSDYIPTKDTVPQNIITLLQNTKISAEDARTILASSNPTLTLTLPDKDENHILQISSQLDQMKTLITTDKHSDTAELFISITTYLRLVATNTPGIVMLSPSIAGNNFLINNISITSIIETRWLNFIYEQELPHNNFLEEQIQIILNLETNKELTNELRKLSTNENVTAIMQGYFIYKMLMAFDNINLPNAKLAINFNPHNLNQFIEEIRVKLDQKIAAIYSINAKSFITQQQQNDPTVSVLLRSLFLFACNSTPLNRNNLISNDPANFLINKYSLTIPMNNELQHWDIRLDETLTDEKKIDLLTILAPEYPRAWLTLGDMHYGDFGFTDLDTALKYYSKVANLDDASQVYFSRAAYICAINSTTDNNFEGNYQLYQTILRYLDPISGEGKKLPDAVIPENATKEALKKFQEHYNNQMGKLLWNIKPMSATPQTPRRTPRTPHRRR